VQTHFLFLSLFFPISTAILPPAFCFFQTRDVSEPAPFLNRESCAKVGFLLPIPSGVRSGCFQSLFNDSCLCAPTLSFFFRYWTSLLLSFFCCVTLWSRISHLLFFLAEFPQITAKFFPVFCELLAVPRSVYCRSPRFRLSRSYLFVRCS